MRFRFLAPLVPVLLALNLLLLPPPSVAQTAEPSPMGPTISAVIAQKLTQLGFAPNDPRVPATITAVGAAIAAAATRTAAAMGAAVTAVPWAAVAVNLGIAAFVAGVPTSLGNDTLTAWQMNPDGTINISRLQPTPSDTSPIPPLVRGQTAWVKVCESKRAVTGGSPSGAVAGCFQTNYDGANYVKVGQCAVSGPGSAICDLYICVRGYACPPKPSMQTGVAQTVSTFDCPSGLYDSAAGMCIKYIAPPNSGAPQPVPPPSGPQSPGNASGDVPASDKGAPLNPAWVAGIANAAWEKAAEEQGYAGIPFPVNAPITPSDARAISGSQAGAWPNVGAFTNPVPVPAASGGAGTGVGGVTGSTPWTVPAQPANPASAVPVPANPGKGDQVNLGPDPGIGAPSLEATPTAEMILNPVVGLMPDIRGFQVPGHSGVCPQPTFTVFDQTFTVSTHCDLFERYRTAIYVSSVLAFSIAALLIVLTA